MVPSRPVASMMKFAGISSRDPSERIRVDHHAAVGHHLFDLADVRSVEALRPSGPQLFLPFLAPRRVRPADRADEAGTGPIIELLELLLHRAAPRRPAEVEALIGEAVLAVASEPWRSGRPADVVAEQVPDGRLSALLEPVTDQAVEDAGPDDARAPHDHDPRMPQQLLVHVLVRLVRVDHAAGSRCTSAGTPAGRAGTEVRDSPRRCVRNGSDTRPAASGHFLAGGVWRTKYPPPKRLRTTRTSPTTTMSLQLMRDQLAIHRAKHLAGAEASSSRRRSAR